MKVFKNATFITCEPDNNKTFAAMAVDKGRIVWIGDDIPNAYKNMPSVDLGRATVTPAFGDTHMHFESFCMFANTFFIMDVASLDEAGEVVRTYADSHPKDKVLLGFGCSAHTVKEDRLPTRTDMDKWTDRPLLIVKYDGHAAVVNSALMNMLSEEVKKDPGCDEATGWLYQNAFFNGVNEVTAKVPSLSIVAGLSKGADALAKAGIGLVHCVEGVGFPKDLDVDMFKTLSPGLPQAFRMFFQTMNVDAVTRRGLTRIGGCFKLALDGCFGSEDAALVEPYANNPDNKGMLYYTQEQINDFCIKANRAGLQIAMHAIGDAAVEQAIVAYETALADFPRNDHRHVLIHCCLCSPGQLDRIAKLKISIAAQAPFIYWKQEPDEYLRGILGDIRNDSLNPLRSMLDRGIVVGDGSDAPCTQPNPIYGMHCAVNRPNPAECITPLEALMMRTYTPAYMSFDEKDRGSLTVGKIADFVVLSDNPLTVPVDQLSDIKVKTLYLQGSEYKTKLRGAASLLAKAVISKLAHKEFI
jgi:predicted amidohydrolase YtcJ